MKSLKSLFVFSLLLSTQAFAERPLENVSDVALVKEVLLRGLEIDASKIATLSAACSGSTLILVAANEAGSKSEMVHFVGGTLECSKNLDAVQNKIGAFYSTQTVSVCSGSSLIAFKIDSDLNIQRQAPRYIGLKACLKVAYQENASDL
jgi:hypothetical protein